MKTVKIFVRTCYSEVLVSEGEEKVSIDADGEPEGEGEETQYHGGLGLKFKFPGDPKKYVVSANTTPQADV